MENYRMNPGRNANYYYQYSRRDTGEILLEGYSNGGCKQDCKNFARLAAFKAGLHPGLDDNLKFFIRPLNDEEKSSQPKERTIKMVMAQYGLNMKAISTRFGIPYRTVQNWCGDVNKCPSYTVKMIDTILEYEKRMEELEKGEA